ncbi:MULTISPECIES: LLM class flavin-dependent oxidoreductase [unclassified Chelatococcus]|jgi:probable LLM family oxidoreductase|uniref:LLM class flavin-dependent oxidoreductase n=1 Tax=unclassified Chelatococcus TaxID=2638111 RepID=UPI001BCB051E|nr:MULTISPECIES: LLM class flavin-dependent oxidoreductase [unclassified Chelatococcus]CAH1661542.1 putative LLM family oxidoreductase [Hyphomicrobiales bacterium]MBS7741272.1 LLM class flavin-dependent oxidoreductase [Chelatococcus sp. HY11]MBX3546246.1 LLM class flavin-dependent oxidoreductase [Chelatococcus sp.]MCO5078095.1 LLM class flavin-dependent oxidoreductase [Chelatococcus sp.]CAH1683064.1 putative LLM family oxidoreductase [Hyphomicrobiales bacterium]
MAKHLELGLDTFGDVTRRADGSFLPQAEVIRNLVDEAVLADQLGIDFIGVGEHHRADFAVSAPEVVLAAIAARTSQIRLGSAVTVLSSDDPIRVFQRFATVDALSKGRAEVILGRGSFTESFPLFGFELRDYERLFEEKLDLFAALLKQDAVTWQGTTRPPLRDQRVYPQVEHGTLKTWIGVGGSPESVVRAARYGLPLMLAIIGGDPARFRSYVDLYGRACQQLEQPLPPIGVHSPGYVADTDAKAQEELFPDYKRMRDQIGAERGWPPMGEGEFKQEVARGSLYVGSPETVARKIAATAKALNITRFDMKYSAGPLPHDKMMRSIELYGSKVVPMVRDMLA